MKDNIIWEGVYQNFSDVPVQGPGFDGEIWIHNSLKKMSILKEHAKSDALLPPLSNHRESLLPLIASLVHHEQKKLRILDFGGGIGFTYYQTLEALPAPRELEFHIVEREPVCEAGREFFGKKDKQIFFHTEIPQEKGSFDIVHTSSALQYVDDWKNLLLQLGSLSRWYLLLVDIYAGDIPTFVTAQNYYGSQIPMRFLNLKELTRHIDELGYELVFKSVYPSYIRGVEQELPMQNLDEEYRLKYACNLLFVSRSKSVSF